MLQVSDGGGKSFVNDRCNIFVPIMNKLTPVHLDFLFFVSTYRAPTLHACNPSLPELGAETLKGFFVDNILR